MFLVFAALATSCLQDLKNVEAQIPKPAHAQFTFCEGTTEEILWSGNLKVDGIGYDGKATGNITFDDQCRVTAVNMWLSPPNNFIKGIIMKNARALVVETAEDFCKKL
jgi:hypothetical protein